MRRVEASSRRSIASCDPEQPEPSSTRHCRQALRPEGPIEFGRRVTAGNPRNTIILTNRTPAGVAQKLARWSAIGGSRNGCRRVAPSGLFCVGAMHRGFPVATPGQSRRAGIGPSGLRDASPKVTAMGRDWRRGTSATVASKSREPACRQAGAAGQEGLQAQQSGAASKKCRTLTEAARWESYRRRERPGLHIWRVRWREGMSVSGLIPRGFGVTHRRGISRRHP